MRGQVAWRRTSQMVAAISSTDRASSQPPSIRWNGQNRLAGLVAGPVRVAVLGQALPDVEHALHAPASWSTRLPAALQSCLTLLSFPLPWSLNANVPPLAYHPLMTHAEPGAFGLLVTSGVM